MMFERGHIYRTKMGHSEEVKETPKKEIVYT